MTKIDSQKVINHLRSKWTQPCPMCQATDWNVQGVVFELREFHEGSMVIGGPIIPVVPVTCGNCGNTILVNAILAGAVEHKEEVNNG